MYMGCISCGNQLDVGATVCLKCGTQQSTATSGVRQEVKALLIVGGIVVALFVATIVIGLAMMQKPFDRIAKEARWQVFQLAIASPDVQRSLGQPFREGSPRGDANEGWNSAFAEWCEGVSGPSGN
jgi:hypothetical protein